MRRSPRRPLILRRRKLPFFQTEPMTSDTQDPPDPPGYKEPSKPVVYQCFPDGIRVMDHPSMRDTQVVVIPKTADLQSVIGALSAKGKESGHQGPNKFILLSEESGSLSQAAAERESGSRSAAGLPARRGPVHGPPEAKSLFGIKPLIKDANCSRLDDSLTNIQWLGKMSPCAFEPDAAKQTSSRENQIPPSNPSQAHTNAKITQRPMFERPPYSYMAMIQFAINSRRNRKMTLKEIYIWIEDNFPYYREVAKPGWKNSIRHNLSLHDMFVREASPDGKIFFWTIRPEANRCLTLDQVYKTGCDSKTAPASGPMLLFPHQQQKKTTMDARKTPTSERRIKPLLPRTDSYLVPIQLPIASSVYLPTPSASFTPACFPQQQKTSRGAKRVRIAPKVTESTIPAVTGSPQRHENLNMEVKQELICTPIKCETPKAPPKRQASSSRRKQRLVHSLHEEPVLLCPSNTFFDSGVVSDVSTFQDVQDSELDELQHVKNSPDREFSFKTPIKGSSSLTSSTPSKPPLNVVEPWKVTPVGKGTQTVLEVSPIRTPGGPAVTPQHDYTTFSFSSTPFKDLPLFNSPRELLTPALTRASTPAESPLRHLPGWGAPTPANRSFTEGLILDTMNDSLSKILVDISFSGLDGEDLESANISWSEFLNQVK